MTDRSDERPDPGQPPAGGTPPGDTPSPGSDTPPMRDTSRGGDAPPPGGDAPPPAPKASGTTPQAQWPQQQSGMTGSEQRNWAVGAHIGALAISLVTGLAVLAPLVVYLAKKDEDVFVREHARESLNFQLTWLIGSIVATIIGVIVTIITVGFALIVLVPAGIGFFVAWVVFMVKASMAASRGEYYRYPLTVRMVS